MHQETKDFISVFPNIDKCSFQTFDDSWEDKTLARIFEYSEIDKLNELNDKWAWIFFSVNQMDKWKRNKDSVAWINCWICEMDWIDKKDQLNLINLCPASPSMIIESKNSFHLYWFAKDWTKENWNDICNWIRNFFWLRSSSCWY